MSFKKLFSRSLLADPERLHFAAHSHHLWPDASFDGQVDAWNDAAWLADRKWERIIGGRRGTGGSEGASYLRSTLDKRVFPELWALRTDL